MQKYLLVPSKIGFILPALVGYLTVSSLFSTHATKLPWSYLLQASVLGVTIGVLLWVFFYALPLTRNASSIVASVATLIVMLWMVFPYSIVPIMVMLSTIIVLYDLDRKYIRAIASVILVMVSLAIAVSLGQTVYAKAIKDNGLSDTPVVLMSAEAPDIYFIVPDRFTSMDGLVASGVDPSWFAGALSNRGFYIRGDSVSNDSLSDIPRATPGTSLATTTRTLRFMASVLNLGADVELYIPYNRASNMVKNHMVGRILKENGYTYHHIGDWWPETSSIPIADHNYVYSVHSVADYLSANELMMAVVDRSWLRDIRSGLLTQAYADRNMYQLETFRAIAGNNEHPKFVFAHILLPHPPYTWTKDGEVRAGGAGQSDTEQYLEQTQFTMWYLLQMVESIESQDSIIIIQSDEGMANSTNSGVELSRTQTDGTLTAWRIPGASNYDLEGITITDILGYVVTSLNDKETW